MRAKFDLKNTPASCECFFHRPQPRIRGIHGNARFCSGYSRVMGEPHKLSLQGSTPWAAPNFPAVAITRGGLNRLEPSSRGTDRVMGSFSVAVTCRISNHPNQSGLCQQRERSIGTRRVITMPGVSAPVCGLNVCREGPDCNRASLS